MRRSRQQRESKQDTRMTASASPVLVVARRLFAAIFVLIAGFWQLGGIHPSSFITAAAAESFIPCRRRAERTVFVTAAKRPIDPSIVATADQHRQAPRLWRQMDDNEEERQGAQHRCVVDVSSTGGTKAAANAQCFG